MLGHIYHYNASSDIDRILVIDEGLGNGLFQAVAVTAAGNHASAGVALQIVDSSDGNVALFADLHRLFGVSQGALGDSSGQVSEECMDRLLRELALHSTRRYYRFKHEKKEEFKPGERLPYAGRVFDSTEMELLTESTLDFWLTSGRFVESFEKEFQNILGVRYACLTNSGSSANLLAFSALTSPSLGERRIRKGDEIITVAAGFPTTVAPAVQFGAVPVFLDVDPVTYNIDCSRLEEAVSERTKAVMIAHTLGNPFDVQRVLDFCKKHNLWLVEDNCDALGAEFLIDGEWKKTGTIGDLATSSFYPPHHITMGEGGAVYTSQAKLKRAVESFRDWGRDCWCPSGKDNTCGKRFDWSLGELPKGYDHKYIYSHFGYNLKVTEMQGAIGLAQLKKLPMFIEARNRNWSFMKEAMVERGLEEFFILPEATNNAKPSWFGFLMTVRHNAPFQREELVGFLEGRNIQTRMLFAGNLLRHPCFDEMRASGQGYRVVGDLTATDNIMTNTLWTGVYPGLTEKALGYIADSIQEFCRGKS